MASPIPPDPAFTTLVAFNWGDATFSDVEVKYGQRSWKAHKAVLCKKSQYFKGCLIGNFKEAVDGVVDLTESGYGPDCIERVLKYCYKSATPLRVQQGELKDHLQMWNAADYFQVLELRHGFTTAILQNITARIRKKEFQSVVFDILGILESHAETALEPGIVQVCSGNMEILVESKEFNTMLQRGGILKCREGRFKFMDVEEAKNHPGYVNDPDAILKMIGPALAVKLLKSTVKLMTNLQLLAAEVESEHGRDNSKRRRPTRRGHFRPLGSGRIGAISDADLDAVLGAGTDIELGSE